jgi:hypothetical protein
MSYYRLTPREEFATLVLGYAELSEPAIRAGVREFAAAVRATRAA